MIHTNKNTNKIKKIKTVIIILAVLCLVAATVLLLVNYNSYAKEGKSGWYKEKGSWYYAKDDGKKARGYEEIKGKPYFFNWQGKSSEHGWVNEKYYCIGNGKLATGWKYVDGKAYYFYQEIDGKGKKLGEAAKSYTTTGNIKIPAKGYLDGQEGKAIGYAIDVLDRFGWNLRAAYRYSSSLECVPGADVHYGFRIHKCALQGFEYGEGNCLAWAGTFCVMAKVLGYDCRLIWGTLPFRGKDVVHGWTEIWEKDDPHVYDPRHNGGKDFSGFNVHYGDKGTYKYNEDSKKYLKW